MRSYNLFEGGRALRIAVGITVLGLLLAGAANAATWTVDDSGGANFTRIQDAIDNASTGDTILVYSGTYYENVDVNKQLTLRGVNIGGGKPVVDDQVFGTSAITLSANGVTLEGFTAEGSYGISVSSSNNTLIGNIGRGTQSKPIRLWYSSNNTLIANAAEGDNGGLTLWYSSNNTLIANNATSGNGDAGISLWYSSNNILINNTAGWRRGPGIGLWNSSNNNTLMGNNAMGDLGGAGISLSSSSNNILISNTAKSLEGHGISLGFSDNNTLISNNASRNSYSGYNNGYSGIDLTSSINNTLIGNNASNNENNGISLLDSSHNTLIRNNATNNIIGIYLKGSINNTLSSNNASNNSFGIYLEGSGPENSNKNKFYNNFFNNTVNFYLESLTFNYWNVTTVSGPNIVGGSYIGGNFWANPDGTGFSQTCPDNNKDGLCDVQYTLADNNSDYLPLTVPAAPTAGSISGFKVNDTNGNGKWDAGEKGISNWTIRLIGIIGNGKNAEVIRKETLTDATGFYKFDNLPAGRYFVIEMLKKGFVATSSPVKRIRLAQGKNSMNNNFTNRPVQSQDKTDDKRDIDDYEAINRDIDKYKEDTNWD